MANRNVSCKIKLYKPVVAKLTGAVSTALVKTGQYLQADLEQSQKMPFRQGILQGDFTFVDDSDAKTGEVRLVSATPYARRLYYHPEYHFDKTENPNAGGRWLDQYLPSGTKQELAQKAFNRIYKKEAGL